MYKMKEVCQMTGLTEKAIRIYMEQKLVEPKVEEGIHRKSYFFEEKDIERLKDVSALRSAGFSVSDIRQMLEKPEMLSLLIEERKALLENEILQKRRVQEALEHLTIEEYSDMTKLADTIEPRSVQAKENGKKRWSRKKRRLLVVLLICVLLSWSGITSGKVGVLIIMASVGLVFGIFAMISAVRYLWHGRHAEKMEQRETGKITAVVEHENVEEYIGERERSTWKDIMAYLMFGLFGEGLWEMLRPDGWYPVISYWNGDDSMIATTRYGGFKNDWQIGEEVPVAWKDGKERLVYICDGKILRKKACVYAVMGMILLAVFGISSVLFCEMVK